MSNDSNTRAHAADAAPGSHGFATEPASGLVPAGVDPIARHTPGPWLRENHTVYALNERGTNRFTCHVDQGWQFGFRQNDARTTEAEVEANACLIAAAPDLLIALRHARRAMIVSVTGIADGLTIHDIRRWIELTDAAIKKAEGL